MEHGTKPTSALLVTALVLFTVVVTFVKIWDTDTWWHLKTGQIITDTGALPRGDVFSHSKTGEEWINDEWLGDYLLFSTFKKYGVTGLQVLVCVFSVLVAFITFQTAARLGAHPLVSAPLVAAAVLASRIRLSPRPEIFSIFLICSVFFLVTRILSPPEKSLNRSGDPVPGKPGIEPVLIPVLQVLWVNIHPGAPFSILILVSAIVSAAAAFILLGRSPIVLEPEVSARSMRILGFTFILTVLATLLNPYGFHGLSAPFKFSGNPAFLKFIEEWAAVPWKQYFSLNGPPGHIAVPLFISAGIAAFATCLKRRRLNIFHIAVFCITLFMALTSRRFIAVFSLIAAPVAAAAITQALASILKSNRIRNILTTAIILILGISAFASGPRSPRFSWGYGVNERSYPFQAIEFIRKNNFSGNMYNTFDLGGPLIWGLYPEHKVFSDGRVPVYGNDFYMDIIRFDGAPSIGRWNEMQDEFEFAFAIIDREREGVAGAITAGEGGWRLVYWDSYTLIYAKDVPEHGKIISENGYRMITPYTALSVAGRWEKLSGDEKTLLISELKRNLEQNSRSIQPILALSYISFIEGDFERSRKLAIHGLGIDPRQARLHGLLGELYLQQGRKKLAVSEFKKAARLRPYFNKRLKEIAED